MAITFKSFLQCLPFVTQTRKPVLLRSKHGVGKSSVVYQFAKQQGLPVVERRASQMTEGDLLGLPVIENEESQTAELGVGIRQLKSTSKTTWCIPDWLKEACQKPVVLFIDEIDRATIEVRQGFFELTDSRKIAGWKLHPDTLIFAAVNSGENTAQYQVAEMDPAELDRWTVFDLEPSIEDWITWGKDNGINSSILEFISQNPDHLEHNKDFEPNKVYPSRRSWDRLNECLSIGKLLEEESKTSSVLMNLISSFVGFEASVSFSDFLRTYSFQVSPEEVIDKGMHEKTKKFEVNDHLALIEKMNIQKWWDRKLTKKQLNNLANYFILLPSEIAMKLVTDISNNLGAEKLFCSFFTIEKVKDYILKILQSDEYQKTVEAK